MSRLGNEFILGSLVTLAAIVVAGLLYPSQNWAHSLFVDVKITDVLIAIFTGLLVCVGAQQASHLDRTVEATRKAANAAYLSSAAALKVELPFITAQQPELLSLDKPVPLVGPFFGSSETLLLGNYSTVNSILFSNSGRTPAYPTFIKVGWKLAKLLPADPVYLAHRFIDRGEIIRADDAGSFEMPRHTIELTKQEIEAMANAAVEFWFFVALTYYDFMETFHEARFCWRRGCPEGVGDHYFASEGHPPAEYTKRT